MFTKVLIANRGEIAGRIGRTLRRLGVASVAACSEADRFTPPVLAADEHVVLGPAPAAQSYLREDAIIAACLATGAQAVHPGYGFLSERAGFADALAAHGIGFIGPTAANIRDFGLKHTARLLAGAAGVPMLPGSPLLDSEDAARAEAASIGYPVILKSTAGGGGIGMRLCRDGAELSEAFAAVQRLAAASFGDGRVYLERFVARARHVEVQIFGDGAGGVVTLGERDCSLQRRHQKVVEETPAPNLPDAIRARLHAAAAALGRSARYESAGTVEFIYDAEREDFFFLEVNTRLQVEHCVTEAVYGVDLVEWMVRQAAGGWSLPAQESLVPRGAAVEARVYAENAAENYRPSTGLLTEVRWADGVRVDTWVETGVEVTPHYDPLLAKVIAHGVSRADAIGQLAAALRDSAVWGVESNLDYLATVLDDPGFRAGTMTTATLGALGYSPRVVGVLAPGTASSVQELPGRLGAWAVGVPPSGPMDPRSHRRANALVGNPPDTAALELTLTGPTLRFSAPARVALCGAVMPLALDGAPAPHDTAFDVAAGQVLAIGRADGPGLRATLAASGGFDAPVFMGSRATFALGGFGGHATGLLRTGDVLRLGDVTPDNLPVPPAAELTTEWNLGVHYGPHGAPDFFTHDDIKTLFDTSYEVHFNSARTGVRLIGPKPAWARPDGGEAGLHPSNIHDNAYAIGSIDFTGDMPILLGPDGPSLGGFVCPAVVTSDELWKLGQVRPGDTVRFTRLAAPDILTTLGDDADPVLLRVDADIPVRVRRAGDANVLVEFGDIALDLRLRLRAQLLLDALDAARLPGVIDLTPGIRSLQVHFDPAALPRARLLVTLASLIRALPAGDDVTVASRTIHLPLSWDDPQAQLAMRRYQELTRPDAPWCPSNIEFIRRINGLASQDDVRRTVFDATYFVMGLGDVYLGAPVAVPLDPRHQLVTTKYNPARPWTPENAVGIGGAYLCIYGMEGPGGYQLFGRTIQVWNAWRRTRAFPERTLLRFFDRIRWYPVEAAELLEARAAFPHGRYDVAVEDGRFSLADHQAFLAANAEAIAASRARQRDAFDAERRDWAARGLDRFEEAAASAPPDTDLPPGSVSVDSPVPGVMWKLLVAVGDIVRTGDAIAVVESMKAEMRIVSPAGGRIRELPVASGRELRGGQRIAVIDAA